MKTFDSTNETQLVKVIVTGDDHDNNQIFVTYEGQSKSVLKQLLDNHSYGYDNDISYSLNFDKLISSNGDGCDFITIVQIPFDTECTKIL